MITVGFRTKIFTTFFTANQSTNTNLKKLIGFSEYIIIFKIRIFGL